MIVGIDPDCSFCGVAEYEHETKYFHVQKMKFFKLYGYLKENRERITLVRIEAGWLNEKSNFHCSCGQTKQAGERIAKNVGANRETGRKTAEMCWYGIPVYGYNFRTARRGLRMTRRSL